MGGTTERWQLIRRHDERERPSAIEGNIPRSRRTSEEPPGFRDTQPRWAARRDEQMPADAPGRPGPTPAAGYILAGGHRREGGTGQSGKGKELSLHYVHIKIFIGPRHVIDREPALHFRPRRFSQSYSEGRIINQSTYGRGHRGHIFRLHQ